MSQFTNKVSAILAFSRQEASRLLSANIGPEHLLLGMMRANDGIITKIFEQFKLNKETVKTQLEASLHTTVTAFPPVETSDLTLNENASNILKLAVLEARLQHQEHVDEEHLLLAILHDRTDNNAKRVLEEQHIDYNSMGNYLKESQPQPQPKGALQLPEEDEEEYFLIDTGDFYDLLMEQQEQM